MLVLSAIIFAFSLFVTGPYGRYPRTRWSGPALPSWIAWMLMEAPQPVGFFLCFLASARRTNPVALVFLGMWTFHYAYRTLIYPFLNRSRTMPLAIVGTGFLLNIGFSYLNGRWLFTLGPERSASWLSGPPFLLGTLLFFGGFILCAASDGILRRLRPAGVTGYRIPMGGAYRWVSCPNYLGELMQWIGWTLATWSLAGLAIALVTAANLVPRARLHHRWYQRTFPEYPVERRALVPFVF
jgi:3-oxo-5-alpha-steroid 4-dehydrogenase 1